ncbi:glycosyl transferase [Dehalococcoides mccartyi]|uniref:Glycosyl transferase n=1 Tax=Dehalococcoides mccartyi TaxID=61435 RepID=A0A2J1DS22_9CHLR|nr:glycosyl transferase [Dehalococcoides mccartyi]
MLISGANFAFKRHVFERIGGYHVTAFSADQYDISTRLSRQGKVLLDRSLIAVTSARRVKKPFLRILRDVFKNIAMVTGWVLQYINQFFRHLYRSPLFFRSVKNTLPIFGLVGILFWGYASPSSQLFGKVYFEGEGESKTISLTFDDGPNPEYTPEILAILDKYGIKATFFVVGKNVETYPELTREILERGHILGNHSYSHDANHALSDFGAKDMLRCAETICKYTGVTPCLYRPPYGKRSPWELAAANEMNVTTVSWGYAVEGKSLAETDNAISKILDKSGPGCILLFHDGYGIDANSLQSDCQLTIKVLDSLISNLLQQGYKFVTLPELLGLDAYS